MPIQLDYKGLGFSATVISFAEQRNVTGLAEIGIVWCVLEDHYCNVVLCLGVCRDAQ